ncbi:MAG TPA: prepilin-type N-terminal cleavage/methylation domain-containing protein [Thermoleophilaceae bacterium]
MARSRQFSEQHGFSLVEILIAISIILVTLLGMVALMNRANAGNSETRTRDAATALAREMVETSQGLSFGSITNASITGSLQAAGFPDDATGTAGWQIVRRNITFTVTATACSVDDPSDGSAAHPSGGGFCTDSPAGTGDGNGDDVKRVTLTITPPAGLGAPVTQATVVGATRVSNPGGSGSGGSGGGNSIDVSSLTITSPTLILGQVSPTCYKPGCSPQPPSATTSTVTPSTVVFQAVMAGTTQKVRFTLDGRLMTTVNGPATTFNWSWSVPSTQPDGTYVVAAQAYDSSGNVAQGTAKKINLILNRYRPDAASYTASSAGRNPLFNNVPEIEWYPSTTTTARVDRDVAAFDVWRYPNGALGTSACLVTGVNNRWCADTAYPLGKTTLQYAMYPSDYAPDGTLRAGTQTGLSRNVMLANTRPNAPAITSVVRSGSQVQISWSLSTGGSPANAGDPNSGDCVDFYRIYSKPAGDASAWAYADRVDRTPFGNPVTPCGAATESSNTITLYEADSAPKQYRITAVDRELAESTLVAPGGGTTF